jgi:hypothetical protein
LLRLWREHRQQIFAVLLGLAALSYLPAQGLRLTAAGWETANRSSEFLYIGIAFVVALAVVSLGIGRIGYLLVGIYLSLIFLGSIVIGWRPDLRVPRAYIVNAESTSVEAEGKALARWSRGALGEGNVVAVDQSNAIIMLLHGRQQPLTGQARGIRDMIFTRLVDDSVVTILRNAGVQYVIVDRRRASWDHLIGIYPAQSPQEASDTENWLNPASLAKFDDNAAVHRIADSGNIVIYDVEALSGATASD